MSNRVKVSDSTWTVAADPPRELAEVLDRYLVDLEKGVAPDQKALLEAHPHLADQLRPYFESLDLLHGATREFHALRKLAEGDNSPSSSANSEQGLLNARTIGDYRIVREVGRGGMGIVYEAHQISLNRRVALKILPFAAVLDQRQIARFRNEAQAAAQLHHAHIVPVFAVGQEQGVYYYAMQYIEGQSLEKAIRELRKDKDSEPRGEHSTKVAGGHRGSTSTLALDGGAMRHSRASIPHGGDFFHGVARLGKQAAEALQHAHEFGIVHRDIKPSNLMLDEEGKLWVTDFGLARIQSNTGVTLTGDVVGTLRYMSPEQASGQSALVDSRTDVYSLGVTLYELLTQQPPFPGEDRETLLRQIIEDEATPPRKLVPALPVDLETIVLSAMAKSRDERYVSAQSLADDLERFLAGRPTLARRPTLVDRAAKWARRHRSLVAVAAAALVFVSIVSIAGVVMLAREQARTSAARDDAEESARRAQQHAARAERLRRQARTAVDQLSGSADRLAQLPGVEGVRRDMLVATLGYYHEFAKEAGDDPRLRQELAQTHLKSGAIANQLGATANAIAEYEASIAMLDQLIADEATNVDAKSQLAVAHNNLALLMSSSNQADAARVHYGKAIAVGRKLVDQHGNDARFASQLAESQANLGMLLDQVGEEIAGEQSLRDAIDVLRNLSQSHPDEPRYVRNLAIACNNLSYMIREKDRSESERLVREAVTGLERVRQEHPNANAYAEDLALCYNNLAALLAGWNQLNDATASYQKAIELQEQLARKSPGVVRRRSDLATTFNNLGVAYCRLERAGDADLAFGRARDLLSTLANDFPGEIAYRSSLAALLNNQALALADAKRHVDALPLYAAGIESQRKCQESLSESHLMRELLSKMYYNYARSLEAAGRGQEALGSILARRGLWSDDGERLIGVAAELAEFSGKVPGDVTSVAAAELKQKSDSEVIATLKSALENGGLAKTDLANDKRFAYLHGNEQFKELAAKVGARKDASK